MEKTVADLMTWVNWIPAISSSSFVGLLILLLLPHYKAWVEKGIQYEFDKKLESLKADHRKEEEALRAEMRSRDDQISTLRQNVLSGVETRQSNLHGRQLQALENLWKAVIDLAKMKSLSRMASSLKMDTLIASAEPSTVDAKKLRDFAETLIKSAQLGDVKQDNSPDKERPFLPPIVWEYFSVYRPMLYVSFAQLTATQFGVGPKLLADPKEMTDLVKSILPHQSENIEKMGSASVPFLVQEMEDLLLRELTSSLDGKASYDRHLALATDVTHKVGVLARDSGANANSVMAGIGEIRT